MPKWELWCRAVGQWCIVRAYLGVGVVLDEDAQHKRFGPGAEVCMAHPTPSAAAPETQRSCSGAWLARVLVLPGARRGPARYIPLL